LQLAHEKSSGQDMSDYFDGVEKKDAMQHQQALDRQEKENAAMRALEAKDEKAAQEEQEQHAHPAAISTPQAKTSGASMKSSHVALEALAGEGSSIFADEGSDLFAKQAHNKHGFHAVHMARDATVKKELEDAKRIARNDLNDCAFTLC